MLNCAPKVIPKLDVQAMSLKKFKLGNALIDLNGKQCKKYSSSSYVMKI